MDFYLVNRRKLRMVDIQHIEKFDKKIFEEPSIFIYVTSENADKIFFPKNLIVDLFSQIVDNEKFIKLKAGGAYQIIDSPDIWTLCLFEQEEELRDKKAYLNAFHLDISVQALSSQVDRGQKLTFILNKSFIDRSNWLAIKNILNKHLNNRDISILVLKD